MVAKRIVASIWGWHYEFWPISTIWVNSKQLKKNKVTIIIKISLNLPPQLIIENDRGQTAEQWYNDRFRKNIFILFSLQTCGVNMIYTHCLWRFPFAHSSRDDLWFKLKYASRIQGVLLAPRNKRKREKMSKKTLKNQQKKKKNTSITRSRARIYNEPIIIIIMIRR